jgi:hypothetical protein
MIISQLIGGLGNQMFQYAIARRLAIFHNVPLKLDTTEFRQYPLRTYGLGHFKIQGEPATENEIARFKRTGIAAILFRLKIFPDFFKPYNKRRLLREQSFDFDPHILLAPNDVYLEGYWQSEKYFKDIEKIIHQDFTLSGEPDNLNKQMAEKIKNCEAVSLHIRRGDYVSNPVTTAYHGICSEEYYQEAISKLESYVKNPHFFVFSDDMEWVKENLETGYPTTLMDFNGSEKDYSDLHLMSLCQHHIIANSSFSWWGAWLSKYSEKIVIAPKKWFNVESINTHDLYPESWIKI